ncbi:MAG: RHS repeat-associated core domain-containing protein, partial [Prevotellaceae bacterium]|nr:RHS repeat-associated core domain-containing protein [Prevotellaceae bacterium]
RTDEGNDDYGQEKEEQYFYHGDHLGSAQMVTGYDGRVYEHLEYTPYGELWVEHAEQDKASVDKTVFRFTGKERDGETGLYYYGARYLNPQTGLWLSADPAMGEYVPQAPINDEAKKANGNLPGMGGVFNTVNLHVYHYAGNNPVKYTDPDGRMPEKVLAIEKQVRIEVTQDITRNAVMYQQGGGGRGRLKGAEYTFCNQATFDIAEAVGFSLTALYRGVDRGLLTANKAYTNLVVSAKQRLILEITPERAQELANAGYLVIAAMKNDIGSGHLATVRPTSKAYDAAEGPMVSNVGVSGYNQVQSTARSFIRDNYRNGKVKFFYDPQQQFKLDMDHIKDLEQVH